MATSVDGINEIYLGSRGPEFKAMITSFLERGNLKAKYINLLTSDDNMIMYGQAFTSDTVNADDNYEVFEQLGDVSANKFIVWYSYKRYPQLFCPSGVPVVAHLRINYGAKKTFFAIGESLGFWPFISASVDERSRKKKDLLEDVFEAIIGVTEYLLDNKYRPGVGYGIIYDILVNVFSNLEMSLEYDDLKSSKTRLKEIFDKNVNIGELEYIAVRERDLQTVYTYLVPPTKLREVCKYCRSVLPSKDALKKHIELCQGRFQEAQREWTLLGRGTAALKKDAEIKSAENSLVTLSRMGYQTVVPKEHTTLCK
jgi:dsRNA-specific ribonuclease